MITGSTEILQRRYDRAQEEIRVLEQLIEDRARALYVAQEDLRESASFLQEVLSAMTSAVLVLDPDGRVHTVNASAARLLGRSPEDLSGMHCAELVLLSEEPLLTASSADSLLVEDLELWFVNSAGERVPMLLSGSPRYDESGELQSVVCVANDLTERRRLELELRQSQKLESVGQLAAGIAHEVNTPIQFIGDSIHFLHEAFEGFESVLTALRPLLDASRDSFPELAAAVDRSLEDGDIEYLLEETPAAVARATEGIQRVSTIVRALKSFAHPGGVDKAPSDLNMALNTTLAVARNEYKYVAHVELDFQPLPEVLCNIGDLNQVFLNLIVNAAHSIEDVRETGRMGTIWVKTRTEGEDVVVTVEDTGCGIPASILQRIYDPFFTTKKVGRGSGQGLAIARNIVVEKHGGRLEVDSVVGRGTKFEIYLPIDGGDSE